MTGKLYPFLSFFRGIASLAVILGLSNCADTADKYEESRGSVLAPLPRPPGETASQQRRLPWELFPLSRTLQGMPLAQPQILQADELLRRGNRQAALKIYLLTNQSKLPPAEREALVLRIASCYLAFNDPQRALAAMSKFFLAAGKSETEVDGIFSLVFAYAYGAKGDFNQSLAWYSRANRQGILEAAQGVQLLLRSAADANLEQLDRSWSTDALVSPLIGQERRRRASPGYAARLPSKTPFWEQAEPESTSAAPPSQAPVSQNIGVILPVSGQFGALGNATRNGIELALENGKKAGLAVPKAEYRDYGGDGLRAAAAARELYSTLEASIILGPLVTDAAVQVSEVARETGKLLLTFSKNEGLMLGDGVFRLAPTVSSQMQSLVAACRRNFPYTRYAVVYPNDLAGQEYANAFKTALTGIGLEPVYERSYDKGDLSSFLSIAAEIEGKPIEALFFPDNLKTASRFFSSLSTNSRKTIRPLGSVSWDNEIELQQSRNSVDGAMFVSPFYSRSTRPEIVNFIAAFHSAYGKTPDFLAAQGFDAATLTLQAFQSAAEHSISLAEAFIQLPPYEGLTGRITVQGGGELTREFGVVALQGGTVSEVDALAGMGMLPRDGGAQVEANR